MKPHAMLRPLVLVPLFLLCSIRPVATSTQLLRFEPVKDVLPARYTMPLKRVFTSAHDYQQLFGHDAPGVDWSREWVVLVSQGVAKDNFHRSFFISQIRSIDDGRILEITSMTSLSVCLMVREPERPMALAKFPAPADHHGLVEWFTTSIVFGGPCS